MAKFDKSELKSWINPSPWHPLCQIIVRTGIFIRWPPSPAPYCRWFCAIKIGCQLAEVLFFISVFFAAFPLSPVFLFFIPPEALPFAAVQSSMHFTCDTHTRSHTDTHGTPPPKSTWAVVLLCPFNPSEMGNPKNLLYLKYVEIEKKEKGSDWWAFWY